MDWSRRNPPSDLIAALIADLAKVSNGTTTTAVKCLFASEQHTAFGRIFAGPALEKSEQGAIAEAVIDWCQDVCHWYRDIHEFSALLAEGEPDGKQSRQLKRDAANASRQLKAAITKLKQTRARSAALTGYYGHDRSWPKPISELELDSARMLIERAVAWNYLWARRLTGSPTAPDIRKRRAGRPADDLLRECEAMLTGLLSSAGLKQRQVARYTFEFMRLAGLGPTSWQSIEQRLLKRHAKHS